MAATKAQIRTARRRIRRGVIISRKISQNLLISYKNLLDRLVRSGVREGRDLNKALVDAARPVNSIFHDLYNWNDSDAAEEYRIEQARHYVKSISIIIAPTLIDVHTRSIKAVISIVRTQGQPREYFTADESTRSASVRALIKAQILSDSKSFMQKYSNYEHLFGAALTNVIVDLNRLVNTII